MPNPIGQFELAPVQGMKASERRAQLDTARFVAVRNLASSVYTKADGSYLMNYQETLDNRDRVKDVIIAHEIANGWVVDDRGQVPAAAPAPAVHQQMVPPSNGAHPAAPQMGVQPPPVQPMPQSAPQYPPVPGQMMAPPPAAPASQVAQMGAPGQQPAPEAPPAAGGRRRRGSAGGAPVAAQAAPAAAPVMPTAPGLAPPPVGAGSPLPVVQGAPFSAPAPVQAAPQATTQGVDVTALMQRLEAIGAELGRGLTSISADIEKLTQRVAVIERQAHIEAGRALAALHHIYGVTPGLKEFLEQQGVKDLAQFRAFTDKYAGNPQ